MSWIKRFRELPTPILILHITAKFVFGVGLGVVLARCLSGFGWWIMLLALIMGTPGAYKVLRREMPPGARENNRRKETTL